MYTYSELDPFHVAWNSVARSCPMKTMGRVDLMLDRYRRNGYLEMEYRASLIKHWELLLLIEQIP